MEEQTTTATEPVGQTALTAENANIQTTQDQVEAVAAPVTSSVVIPDNWRDAIPDEVKSDPSFQSIVDVAGLAKSYVNAQKMVGADKIVVPGKHATPDDWKAVYNKLGLADSLDSYEIDIPKEGEIDEEMQKEIKETFFKAGVLPNQAQEILKWYVDNSAQQTENAQKQEAAAQEEAVGELKKEWGQAYDSNVQKARMAIKDVDSVELNEWLDKSGNGNNPVLIKAFAKIGDHLKEDTIEDGETNKALSPGDAETEINNILSNRVHPYHNKMHANHGAAVQEVQKLHQQKFGVE